jgi:hypothetical protein
MVDRVGLERADVTLQPQMPQPSTDIHGVSLAMVIALRKLPERRI